MSTITTHELAGVFVSPPITLASLLGVTYAAAWIELVADDHSFTFNDCFQKVDRAATAFGPDTAEIMWMARK